MRMMAGPYLVQVTVRANCRRMILRCRKAEGTVAMSVPYGTTEAEIRHFLDRHTDWIRQQMGAPQSWQPRYRAGERHWCLGRLVTLGVDAPAGQEFLRWRNAQLAQVLRQQLGVWTRRMGVTVSHVTLQEMSSRWGSCRPQTRRFTFNTKLGLYAPELIEETVVHELCHLFHANHSRDFYALMTRYLPDWRVRKNRRDALNVRPQPAA